MNYVRSVKSDTAKDKFNVNGKEVIIKINYFMEIILYNILYNNNKTYIFIFFIFSNY